MGGVLMKKWIWLPVVLALLGILAFGGFLFHRNYLVIGGALYTRSIASLDLSGAPLAEPDKLPQLSSLSYLNVRDTGITEAEYESLCESLPGCRIDWSVPFQGGWYPQDIRTLAVASLSDSDIAQLAYFPELKSIDATDCTDYDALLRLTQARPDLEVTYAVPLDGQLLPQDTVRLALGGGTADDLAKALAYLPSLSYVDATGCTDYAGLQALQAQYPSCDILYNVTIDGISWPQSTTDLLVSDPDPEELGERLCYLPKVDTVTLTGRIPSNDAVLSLREAYPDILFRWSFQLCGKQVQSTDTEVDLSGIPLESTQEIENALRYFNALDRVILCDCGLADEQIDAMGQRNPDVRFIWTVSIGPLIRLRTDATYFMPFQYGVRVSDADTAALKYCVDLQCIDFGHMDISDISYVANMPHMKYLLLADTQVRDISPLAGLEELVYLELFLTYVQDYSPLLSCPNLEDLNICYAVPNDVSDLCRMPWLKNLWMKGYWQPEGQAQLRESLPETRIVFTNMQNSSSTANGWRKLPNYYAMRDLLGMFYMDED